MIWYIVICALFLLIYLFKNALSRKKVHISGLLPCILVLWFFAFARDYSVGADTKNYVVLIEQLRNSSIADINKVQVYNWSGRYIVSWEFGFKFLIWLLSNTIGYYSTRAVVAGYSLVILIILYKTIKRDSQYPILSVWLYLTLGFFQTSLNMTQNALAIVIMLWSLKYVKERKLLKWILAIVLATSIHFSSLIYLPLYWLGIIRFDRKKTFITVCATGVVLFAFERLLSYIVRFVPLQYVKYLNTSSTASSELFVLLLHVFIFAVIIVCADLRKKNMALNELSGSTSGLNIYLSPYYVIFILEIVAYLLSIYARGLLRVASLFSPVVIIFFPQLVNNILNDKVKKHTIAWVVLISLVSYIIRMMVNNVGLTLPYVFGF